MSNSDQKSQGRNTMAFHHAGQTEGGDSHVVGIGDLRVIISEDGDGFFAQSLEIDYAAEGDSLEEVQKAFTEGFVATINLHLRIFGTIDKLLTPAPAQVWQESIGGGVEKFRYYVVSHHTFSAPETGGIPFNRITFLSHAA